MTQPAEQTDFRYFKCDELDCFWRLSPDDTAELRINGDEWMGSICSLASFLEDERVVETDATGAPLAPAAPGDEQKCSKCGGAGWVWWNELDQYSGPALSEAHSDDTRYPCDACGQGQVEPSPPAGGGEAKTDHFIYANMLAEAVRVLCGPHSPEDKQAAWKLREEYLQPTPPPAATPGEAALAAAAEVFRFTHPPKMLEESPSFCEETTERLSVIIAKHFTPREPYGKTIGKLNARIAELERESAGLREALERIAGDWMATESAGVSFRRKIARAALEGKSALAGGEEGKDV